MSEKKGIFGFFKGWASVTEEEEQQRSHALSQEQESGSGNIERRQESVVTEEIQTFVIEKCEELLSLCQFSGKVKLKQNRGHVLTIEIFDAGDDLGRIIGKNGVALDSIQVLLKFFVVRKFNTFIKVVVDAGDYSRRHQSHVKRKALRAADDVLNTGGSIKLEPMNSSDRRFIHMLFEKNEEISTESEGSGGRRYVVLSRKEPAHNE